jgi:hypothetical protein
MAFITSQWPQRCLRVSFGEDKGPRPDQNLSPEAWCDYVHMADSRSGSRKNSGTTEGLGAGSPPCATQSRTSSFSPRPGG